MNKAIFNGSTTFLVQFFPADRAKRHYARFQVTSAHQVQAISAAVSQLRNDIAGECAHDFLKQKRAARQELEACLAEAYAMLQARQEADAPDQAAITLSGSTMVANRVAAAVSSLRTIPGPRERRRLFDELNEEITGSLTKKQQADLRERTKEAIEERWPQVRFVGPRFNELRNVLSME